MTGALAARSGARAQLRRPVAQLSARPGLRAGLPAPRARPQPRRPVVTVNTATPTKGDAQPAKGAERASLESFDFDSVLQRELVENGPRSTRRTKVICTIGPKTCSSEMLETLAEGGMNCARLNLCHNTHEWHAGVIQRIRELNAKRGFSVAIMLDTEGSEVHVYEAGTIEATEGMEITLTIRKLAKPQKNVLSVNYEGFIDDITVGDTVVVDGGMVTLEVVSIAGPDVICAVVDPGLILSRANLTFRNKHGALIRGKNSSLPVITAKDWLDIDFAISQKVDFLAVSFVKTADVLGNVKSYISSRLPAGAGNIEVVAKIESCESLPNIASIVDAADIIMIARGDLGAQIPLQDVPAVQQEIVLRCRKAGTPVIVASHLLQSMIQFPTPTRAEVADIGDIVRQKADALMLCGESAMGAYPEKAVSTACAVASRVEEWGRQEARGFIEMPCLHETMEGRIQEEICISAAFMADKLKVAAICVFTRRGTTASMLSRCRPDVPIFAFTDDHNVRRQANMRWGVCPFRFDFTDDVETNVRLAFTFLKERGLATAGDRVVLVSDLKPSPGEQVRSIQVRTIK